MWKLCFENAWLCTLLQGWLLKFWIVSSKRNYQFENKHKSSGIWAVRMRQFHAHLPTVLILDRIFKSFTKRFWEIPALALGSRLHFYWCHWLLTSILSTNSERLQGVGRDLYAAVVCFVCLEAQNSSLMACTTPSGHSIHTLYWLEGIHFLNLRVT